MLEPEKKSVFEKHRALWIWGGIVFFVGLAVLMVVLLILPGGIVGGYALYRGVESPSFCGVVCHNMKPAYQSWQSSTHHGVRCQECHSEPGFGGFIKGTVIAAIRESYQYLTQDYGEEPMVLDIADENCLRESCHKLRLLKGETKFKRVVFDHEKHMEPMPEGKELGCTSCHSQMVVGDHMTVTESVCFICHFKHNVAHPTPSSCPSCHTYPIGPVEYIGMRFSHEEETAEGHACEDCHHEIGTGEGGVKKERCQACHKDESYFERHEDAQFMHEHHVAKHTVKCFLCHDEISHSIERPLELSCVVCHEQEDRLYRGVDVYGTSVRPSVKYRDLRMDCGDCHLKEENYKAKEEGCETCHKRKKGRTILACQTEVKTRLSDLLPLVEKVEAQLEKSTLKGAVPTQATAAYGKARWGVEMVSEDVSSGVHNFGYSKELLTEAERGLRSALSALSPKEAPAKKEPEKKEEAAPHPDYGQPCSNCHE